MNHGCLRTRLVYGGRSARYQQRLPVPAINGSLQSMGLSQTNGIWLLLYWCFTCARLYSASLLGNQATGSMAWFPTQVHSHDTVCCCCCFKSWQHGDFIMLSHLETRLPAHDHSVTLSWHWASQSLPYLNNAERQAISDKYYFFK